MKSFIIFCGFFVVLSCTAQTYPLRTFTDIPENAYLKDTNNELLSYEGTWRGTWDNKIIIVTFKKITNRYNENLKYYRDYLIGKFKVLDNSGNILFDNTNLSDDTAKIWGGKFRKVDDKYSFSYIDPELCGSSGNIRISFTDSTRTKLNWNYYYHNEIVTDDCPYYNTAIPQPLPEEIVLTKQ